MAHFLLIIQRSPLQIPIVQGFDQQFCRRQVGCYRNIVLITKRQDVVDAGIIPIHQFRIFEINDHVQLILLDERLQLLHTTQTSSDAFVNLQIRNRLDQITCRVRCILRIPLYAMQKF